jgi:hypothetical protein
MEILKTAYRYLLAILNPIIFWIFLTHLMQTWGLSTGKIDGSSVTPLSMFILAFMWLFILWALHKLNQKLNKAPYVFYDNPNSFIAFVYIIGYLGMVFLTYGWFSSITYYS